MRYFMLVSPIKTAALRRGKLVSTGAARRLLAVGLASAGPAGELSPAGRGVRRGSLVGGQRAPYGFVADIREVLTVPRHLPLMAANVREGEVSGFDFEIGHLGHPCLLVRVIFIHPASKPASTKCALCELFLTQDAPSTARACLNDCQIIIGQDHQRHDLCPRTAGLGLDLCQRQRRAHSATSLIAMRQASAR